MPEASGWAPGRVNLIGEHTDYNGGFVLPIALGLGVAVEIADARALFVEGEGVDERSPRYAAAVCRALGVPQTVDVRVEATLPAGAGLGSSAAFELALARALRELHGLRLDDRDLALACHRAENEIAPCGVMDQLTAAVGEPGAALMIDCTSLDTRAVALPDDFELAVLDSGARHSNAAGSYRERRAECEAAARSLGVAVLRELQPNGDRGEEPEPDFEALPDPLGRRAQHVFEENQRVLEAVAALEVGNLDALAVLMHGSHESQRDLFEVSTAVIDALVTGAEHAGALAARLTGGGFGGAVVALCRPGRAEAVAGEANAPLLALVQSSK